MKKIISILSAFIMALTMTSCLESNLDDIDTYAENDITSVVAVYHRYYVDSDVPAAAGKQVMQAQLRVTNVKIDAEAGTVTFNVSTPSNLPASEKGKVSADNLVVIVGISTAAVITPTNGSAEFGKPGDWSKANTYEVQAGDGSKKAWTVTLTLK